MKRTTLALFIALAAGVASAKLPDPETVPRGPTFLSSESFLASHPDLRWRVDGLKAQVDGDHERALGSLRRAARYADKPAAAALAEIHWSGQGVPEDRVLGYVWMDIAAERQWEAFAFRREVMWAHLTDDERARALEVGRGLYAEFSDAVAKPRMERVLRRERSKVTGSRTGFAGALTIEIPGAAGTMHIDASEYYADRYWDPKQYWRWQASIWAPEQQGRVDVGDVTATGEAPAP